MRNRNNLVFPRSKKHFVRVKEAQRSVTKLENAVCEISPAHSTLECYEYLYSPPEVEYPVKEYVQKNDSTPLPVENLSTHCRDLSKAAFKAWHEWVSNLMHQAGLVNHSGLPFTDKQKTDFLKSLILSDDERVTVTRYERVVKVEEAKWLEATTGCSLRLLAETPGFRNTSIPKAERYKYSPSQGDREFLAMVKDHQTRVWRKGLEFQDKQWIANCTFRDDPDFIPPINSNGNFRTITPASRMYNAKFEILHNSRKTIWEPDVTKGKDYTDINDIIYLYKNKGILLNPNDITVLHCLYEYDLRVTYSNSPNPREYKKIDTHSKIGTKLMQLLNEQPHLWKEFSWTYDNNQKKVAYGFLSVDQKSCFWLYLDDIHVKRGNSILGKRRVYPWIEYEELVCQEGFKHKLIARLTYHKSYLATFPKNKRAPLDAKLAELELAGYKLVKKQQDYNDIVTDIFVHRTALTKKDRDKILLTETNWQLKYGANKSGV